MATTTKSTRKKPAKAAKATKVTKTPKTTSAAAAKKNVQSKKAAAAKTAVALKNSETKSESAQAKSPTRVKRGAELTPLEKIRSLHISRTVVYIVLSLLVGFLTTTSAIAVLLGIQTRDEFSGSANVVLTNSNEVLYNIEPKYVLILSLLLGALGSVLLASKLRKRYEGTLETRTSGFRWLIFGFSSAVMFAFVQMTAGINDFSTLKLSGILIILTTMFAWIAERDNIAQGRTRWLAFLLSLFTGTVAWIPMIGTLIGTPLYGMERFGWQVYALALATLIGFGSFALIQYRQLKANNDQGDFTLIEARYLRADLVTKFVIVMIVLAAYNS